MPTLKGISFILIFFIFYSCKKDCEQVSPTIIPGCPPVSIDNFDCELFPEHNELVTVGSEEGTQYLFPYFNPNNSDEFVYYERNIVNGEYFLMKYNLVTNLKEKLFSGSLLSQPKWSSKGWIALNNSYQIFRIRSDGTNLEQLTIDAFNLYPAWSADGQELYWMYSPNLGLPTYLLASVVNSNQIDTLYYRPNSYNEISKLNKLYNVVVDNGRFIGGANNLAEFQLEPLLSLSNSGFNSVGGLSPSPDGNFLYLSLTGGSNSGIYQLSLKTGLITLLKRSCDTKGYSSLSCSNDSRKLIVTRADTEMEFDNNGNFTGTFITNRTISIIDLCSLEENRIEIE